ncbi:unnamed protein product [Prunus armeniaca]
MSSWSNASRSYFGSANIPRNKLWVFEFVALSILAHFDIFYALLIHTPTQTQEILAPPPALVANEGCVGPFVRVHEDLVIAEVGIHEAEEGWPAVMSISWSM